MPGAVIIAATAAIEDPAARLQQQQELKEEEEKSDECSSADQSGKITFFSPLNPSEFRYPPIEPLITTIEIL